MGTGPKAVVVTNGDGATLTSSLSFTSVAGGSAYVSVDVNTNDVDFGTVTVGGSSTVTMDFINTGTTAQTVTIGLPNADFSAAGGCLSTLGSGSSCTEVITFTPSTTGSRGGTVTVMGMSMTFVATGA
jgi:hypothetical protein